LKTSNVFNTEMEMIG